MNVYVCVNVCVCERARMYMSVTCAHIRADMHACMCEGQKTTSVVVPQEPSTLLGSRDGSVWDLGGHRLA